MSDLLIQLAEAVTQHENGNHNQFNELANKYSSNTTGWTRADLFDYGYEAAVEMGLIK